MSISINNEQCRIAANLLETEPGLLDYRLVNYLNSFGDSPMARMARRRFHKTEILTAFS